MRAFLLSLLLVFAGTAFAARHYTRSSTQYSYCTGVFPSIPAYPFTYAAWVKWDTTSGDKCILSIGDYSDSLRLFNWSPWYGAAYGHNGWMVGPYDPGTLATNTWYHYCFVFTSTTNRSIYINGSLGATYTTSAALDLPSTGTNVWLGAFTTTGTPYAYMYGDFAECAFWDVALSAGEIDALSKGVSPLRVRPASLKFHVPLAGPQGQEINTIGKPFTSTNTPTEGAHPRIYR